MTTDQTAVSDGTMPCPVPHPDGVDAPCTKTIPRGWTADEGHGGGHCWMAPKVRESFAREDHYDAGAALSGQPFDFHRAEDCPGRPECRDWRAVAPDLSEPNGCAHCGHGVHRHCDNPRRPGTVYAYGVGRHAWTEPTDAQRLKRMKDRRRAAGRTPWPVIRDGWR